jgi:outer membrane protein
MKKVFGILLFAALVLTAQDGFAQSLKTGHINRDEIIMTMPDYDSAMNKYNAFGQELTNALELMQVEYNNKLDQYVKESKNLTDLVKANKEQELADMQNRINNFQQQAQAQLQEKQAELLNPIIEKATNAINAVAKEGGYIYIYDVRTLVYVDTVKSTDIGPLVKTKLGVK